MPSTFASVLAPRAEIWSPMQEMASGRLLNTRAGATTTRSWRGSRPGTTRDAATRELLRIGQTPQATWPRPPWADLGARIAGYSAARPCDRQRTARRSFAIIGAVVAPPRDCIGQRHLRCCWLAAPGADPSWPCAWHSVPGRGTVDCGSCLPRVCVLALARRCRSGLGVARVGLRALLAASPPGLPRAEAIHLDLRAFVFAADPYHAGRCHRRAWRRRRATLRADVTAGLRPGTVAQHRRPRLGARRRWWSSKWPWR